MNNTIFKLSLAVAGVLMLGACGGGSSSTTAVLPQNGDTEETINKLAPQSGTQSNLFYGNSLHSGLGSLKNVKAIKTTDTSNPIVSKEIDDRKAAVGTSFTYSNGSYSDLHMDAIYYTADNTPYKVSMLKTVEPEEVKNSSVADATGVSRTAISHLGTKQYAVATNDDGSNVLITPDMGANDAPVAFNDRTLLTLSYQSFSGEVDGYIVIYDADNDKSTTNELQKCNLDMTTCTKITDVNDKTKYSHGRPYAAYDMTLLGDLLGSVDSIYLSENKIYKLNKADASVTQMGTISPDSASHSLKGSEIFYLESDNIYKSTLDGAVTQLSTDGKATDLEAFTDDMVMYGNDDYMYAVARDGSLKDAAIELSFTTKTRGQKYPFDLAIGKQYLYTTYNVNTTTGKNTYSACKLEDGKKECKTDSYWSAVTAAKDGTINTNSTYKYTPYAYIRVDDADTYGGGKVKAIDPKHPLEDGLTMGTISTYNFQTFVNSGYDDNMIDSDGDIVLYAKNDLDYRGDAFLMNLRKENSLVNLTNEEAPTIDALTEGRDHCHGRKCTVCHSFAGGKIYVDKEGSSSAKNHNIRFDFSDGSDSILAKIRKGSGENFSTPLEGLVGKNFKAVVVDENGTDVVRSIGFYHEGVAFFNCNYCHGRNGDLKYDAPNVITIED
ncbi:MAG: hypothetical protein DRG24_03215 [Epsilonproteobacteria bacterium]|nr:MAG: hypothetical protein DRG24_03215 [Campylobacterota bacterium]